jgi:hypothetical protein
MVARGPDGYGGTGSAFNAASPLLFNTTLHGVSQALILPGSADDYASIESVNLLTADEAHSHQAAAAAWASLGNAKNFAQSTDLTPTIGSYHMEAEPQVDTLNYVASRLGLGTSGVPVTVGETYTLSFTGATDTSGRKAYGRIRWQDSGGSVLSNSDGTPVSTSTTTLEAFSVTAVAPASAAYATVAILFVTDSGNFDLGEKVYWDSLCFRPGSDTAFVPSINVVGDLDVRWRGSWRDWTPGGNGSTLAAQYASGDLAWSVGTDSSDHLCSIISDDGSATEEDSAGASPAVGDMGPLSVRALIVPGGTNETLFQASDDADLSAASWGTVGSGQTTAKTSIHSAGDEPITIGYRQGAGSGADEQPMVIHAVQIRDGEDGPIVTEVDFTDSGVWSAGDTTAETDQGQTVTIHQGTLDGIQANVVDRSCFVSATTSQYLTWDDDDALDIGATQDATWAFGIRGDTIPTSAFPLYKQSGNPGYRVRWALTYTARTYLYDSVPNSANDFSAAPAAGEWYVFGGVVDRTADTIESFLDGAPSGSPGDISAVGDASTVGDLIWGKEHGGYHTWLAFFRSALSDAQMAELGGWDGTVANEPSWLRDSVTEYVNADDPDLAAEYISSNTVWNLATLTLDVPLLTNTPTFYAPTVHMTMEQGLVLTRATTFHAPQVNMTLVAPLLTNTPTFYAPQLDMHLTEVGLLASSVTLYAPQVDMNLTVPLLTITATFYRQWVYGGVELANAPAKTHTSEMTAVSLHTSEVM